MWINNVKKQFLGGRCQKLPQKILHHLGTFPLKCIKSSTGICNEIESLLILSQGQSKDKFSFQHEAVNTEVRFANLISGGFTTMAVINQLERKLAKRISV